MKRLVCVVEGHGEVEAVPSLCVKILDYLGIEGWVVDKQPIRHPRSRLVDETVPSPLRPANRDGIRRVVTLAKARPANGVLLLCDSDDDCAAFWANDVQKILEPAQGAVMAIREFEAWLLSRFSAGELRKARVSAPERKRNAKGALKKLIKDYKPSTHQLSEVRKIDIDMARRLRHGSTDDAREGVWTQPPLGFWRREAHAADDPWVGP